VRTHATLIVLLLLTLAACGGDAPPREAYNRALIALEAGDLDAAQAAAAEASETGYGEVTARSGFLLGNVAFAKCEIYEQQAAAAEAEPCAIQIAIQAGEKARDRWQAAAMSRDWPAARRNVERAVLKLAVLAEKKAAAEGLNRRTRPETDINLLPGGPGSDTAGGDPTDERDESAPPGGDGEDTGETPETAAATAQLAPDAVLALLETLAAKEQEKRTIRESRQRSRKDGVEKDW